VNLPELVHFLHLLLALLEPPEVVLDQERRVELAHRYVVVSCSQPIVQSYSPRGANLRSPLYYMPTLVCLPTK